MVKGTEVAALLIASISLLLPALTSPLRGSSTIDQNPPQKLTQIRAPIIHVKGNHYEVGYQIGTRLKENLLSKVNQLKSRSDWDKLKANGELFLAYSRKHLPEYIEEYQGAADALGIKLEELFPTICEELFYPEFFKGCSDLIASGDVTEDGSVLVAHNNDTEPGPVTIIHYQVTGEPEILAVGYGGLGISVGYNSAGISLTGNQVDSTDIRVGVPRMLLVRKILAAKRIGEAIDAAIMEQRASNYNQVIADANGEIYSIEGSATDYEAIYAVDGYLVHTNHYVSPRMRKFELYPNQITGSIVRYNRATRLMKGSLGHITMETLMRFLRDHVNHPYSICRHGEEIKTTFSIIINLSTLKMLLAPGNPCEVEYSEYEFTTKE